MHPYYHTSNKNKIYIRYDTVINLVSWQPSTLAPDGKHAIFFLNSQPNSRLFPGLFVKFVRIHYLIIPRLEIHFQFRDFFPIFKTAVWGPWEWVGEWVV